ncbi:MAG: Oligopeptide transport ATP-binding protein OppF [Candidatus Anoxychlamydiales bacterium]|nr:Oligopeptide transport ATP-binding protein OppF [Candidatus Anoxychlamydiales bacterium]
MQRKIIEVKNLKKIFKLHHKTINAVDDVSFSIYENETLAIVGESGSGKTTIARMIIDLEKPSNGTIFFNHDLINKNKTSKNISMIFQDPYLSLNPKMKINEILKEPIKINTTFQDEEIDTYLDDLLKKVNLPSNVKSRFPHEFSGGQKQRIAIARAISINPKLIICDECMSALDVSIQAQIINLLKDLQKKLNLSYLFISHDLAVVRNFATRVIVMHMGKIVETGSVDEIFKNPKHPYTKKLLDSILKI